MNVPHPRRDGALIVLTDTDTDTDTGTGEELACWPDRRHGTN
ncbi:hypothetical protein [Streptomyces wuyuanensis]